MVASLQPLFTAIDRVKDEPDLKTNVTSKLGEHFAATRSGIFFFDQLSQLDPNIQKILKVALSIELNPIARYLVERHAPVHEGLVISPKAWKMICPRPDHWHVMVGPIVVRGQLVGAVGCTRDRWRSLPEVIDACFRYPKSRCWLAGYLFKHFQVADCTAIGTSSQ